ncbi:hypothetical protein [Marinomonas transparens]|uniref:Phage Tail Collar Domain protein n=1 Tax=Marinomonas transparens TaxID=2795388 RepID=A0A934JRQ6_9GAMM|nr:hypothetical protein [Marinomonas transparens]MBJ7537152.1 hypothetical protein [Marinomonas transparens]
MNYPNSNDLYQGKFTDGNPVAGIRPSIASANHMNALYDEVIQAIKEGDVTEDRGVLSQLALSMSNQMRAKKIFLTTGTANDIVLTTPAGKQPVKVLQDNDEIHFTVALTNTSTISVSVDGLAPIAVSNIVSANQLFNGALATISYINGAFWLTKQINPLTGNDVKDMAKVITDSLDIIEVGEIALDGAELTRAEHPVYWAKVQATSNLIDQASKDADLKNYAGYYGDGDGETTFTLPTLGGEFIRGYDNGRGVDTGRGFASFQGDAIRNIVGEIGRESHTGDAIFGIDNVSVSGVFTQEENESTTIQADGVRDQNTVKVSFDASLVVPTANENRPRSIAYFFKTRI